MSSENLNNLSIKDLKKLVTEEYKQNKKLRQEKKKEKLIQVYKKLQKQNEKLRQEKSKPKPKPKPKQNIKTFDECFQECIKNKSIPKDTPEYLKKALERAMKEYDKGIKHEKSALENFAEKYVIDGKPGITPFKYFAEKASQLKEFLRNHRNIKVRMIFVCIVEKQISEKINKFIVKSKSYFNTETYINLESTDVKVILSQMIKEILEKIRYLHPIEKHKTRLTDIRKYENDLNFKGIDFPVKLKDIPKFENQNPNIPGINVFSVNDNNKIFPLRQPKRY